MKRYRQGLIAVLILIATVGFAESWNEFSIRSADALAVKVALSKQAKPALEVVLAADKAQELSVFTQDNLNQKVVIRINDEVVAEPLVRAQIAGGQMVIELDDQATALRLATALMQE